MAGGKTVIEQISEAMENDPGGFAGVVPTGGLSFSEVTGAGGPPPTTGPTMVATGGSSQSSGSSGQSTSTSTSKQYTPMVPPVLDILAEMRARRESTRLMGMNIVQALMSAAPMAVPEGSGGVFPGLEKGGLGDILMGIISGQGAAGAGVLDPLRKPGTMSIPISSMNVPEPGIGEEMGDAMGISGQIMDAIKNLLTGTSEAVAQSTDQSSSGGSSWSQTPWEPGGGDMDLMELLGIIDALMGGGQGQQQGVPGNADSYWIDEDGNVVQGAGAPMSTPAPWAGG